MLVLLSSLSSFRERRPRRRPQVASRQRQEERARGEECNPRESPSSLSHLSLQQALETLSRVIGASPHERSRFRAKSQGQRKVSVSFLGTQRQPFPSLPPSRSLACSFSCSPIFLGPPFPVAPFTTKKKVPFLLFLSAKSPSSSSFPFHRSSFSCVFSFQSVAVAVSLVVDAIPVLLLPPKECPFSQVLVAALRG